MTEKVFYQDSHKVSCEAEVLACEPKGTQYLIALDRTVFFPEGGWRSMQIPAGSER